MVTIQNVDVRLDVEGEGDEAVFARLFEKHMKLWRRLEDEMQQRRRMADADRRLGDRPGARRVITPLSLLDLGLVRAYLEIEQPRIDDPVIPLRFNPTEYQLQKSNNFAEIAIPGLESPPIQFIRGAAETLSVEFLVDTSDTLENVREKYVDKLRGLLRIDAELHAPPIVRFIWDRDVFRGVLESLDATYQMFDPEGCRCARSWR
jgi:hypothetical protein